MHSPTLVTVLLSLLLFSNTAFAIDRFDISIGGVTRPGLDAPIINSFHSGFTWNTDYFQSNINDYQQTLRVETAIGVNHTSSKNIYNVSLSPVLHYQLNTPGWPDFFELGVGITYISQTHWKPYNNMGSHLLFADRIGLGYYLGTTEVSLNFTTSLTPA